MCRYFKKVSGVSNGNYIYFWKSKELSNENITAPTIINYSLNLQLSYLSAKTRVEFKGSYMIIGSYMITYYYRKIVNIYIVYEINKNFNISSYPILENCLFGAFRLTKNADIDGYKYSGYRIGFDRNGFFLYPSGGTGKNCIIFGADMSSSAKIDTRISFLGKGPTQGLEHALSVEKMHSIYFTENKKIFCLSLHYNGANSYVFVNGKEIHKFKAKNFEIVATLFFSYYLLVSR